MCLEWRYELVGVVYDLIYHVKHLQRLDIELSGG